MEFLAMGSGKGRWDSQIQKQTRKIQVREQCTLTEGRVCLHLVLNTHWIEEKDSEDKSKTLGQ